MRVEVAEILAEIIDRDADGGGRNFRCGNRQARRRERRRRRRLEVRDALAPASRFELQRDLGQAAQKMETVPIPRLRLRVTAAAETLIRSGHPWLFANSIREENRAGRLGELAVIFDRNDRFLAIGLFDPESPIRVRVLHAGKPSTID